MGAGIQSRSAAARSYLCIHTSHVLSPLPRRWLMKSMILLWEVVAPRRASRSTKAVHSSPRRCGRGAMLGAVAASGLQLGLEGGATMNEDRQELDADETTRRNMYVKLGGEMRPPCRACRIVWDACWVGVKLRTCTIDTGGKGEPGLGGI